MAWALPATLLQLASEPLQDTDGTLRTGAEETNKRAINKVMGNITENLEE